MIKLKIQSTSLAGLFFTEQASAHTSQQSFVLLLPTNVYITAGVIAVALTVIILALLPAQMTNRLFDTKPLAQIPTARHFACVTSLLALAVLVCLLFIGLTASHDPLKNLLPLSIWTIWWIGLVCLQGMIGNLWHWINPWSGLYQLTGRLTAVQRSTLAIPDWMSSWPAVAIYIVFSCFALADPAPEDPVRLSVIVGFYWLFTFTGMLLFGASQWLDRCECFTIMMRHMARHAVVGSTAKTINAGLPGWQHLQQPLHSVSAAVFILTLLAAGSFDGLNETFWWLAKIGVNPLEFPGRSAVVVQTVSGLLFSVILLIAIYSLCIWLGITIANTAGGGTAPDSQNTAERVTFKNSFTRLAVAILPIALAYHFAHFLTVFLVNIQYTLAAATDPLQNGRDILGLGRFYVTTGFFNTRHTVRTIWLTQAVAVVAGHVLSVIIAHTIAARIWKNTRRALLSQLPLAVFMIFYTFLGLWLLAAPRGA